jgi:hypothetical protein
MEWAFYYLKFLQREIFEGSSGICIRVKIINGIKATPLSHLRLMVRIVDNS